MDVWPWVPGYKLILLICNHPYLKADQKTGQNNRI